MPKASTDNLEDEPFECVVEPARFGGSSAAAPVGPKPIGRAALRSRRARRGDLEIERSG